MAKRYINETGLKHLWSKSLNLFAQKNVLNEYAKQKDVNDVKQSLDSKADLVGGKIPVNQLPDDISDGSMLVGGIMNPQDNFNVTSLDKGYSEIAEALLNNIDVRLNLTIPLGDEHYVNVVGSVEVFRPTYGMIEFGVVIDTALDGTNNEKIHHFRITLTDKDSVSTVIKVLGDDSSSQGGSDPTQEIVYMDCFIDLQHLTLTTTATYDEIASLIESGKYVIGRGTYALLASPINMAYLPMSAYNKEESSIYFKGLSQMLLNGVTAVVDITVILKKYDDNVFKVRVISIAKELN